MKRNHAFTLIELLVVIAIIAILAAILFPVFAQAKASAKGAASVSNVKQNSLACLMYSGDYDDVLPLGTAWNTGQDILTYGAGMAFSTWSWAVMPYMKTSALLMDPLTSPNGKVGTLPQSRVDGYYIQYGYNYTFLSPYTGPSTAQVVTGTSATAVAAPANTVMLGSKWANSENKSGFDWGTGFPGGMLAAAAIDVPDCWNITQWCLDSWGAGGFHDATLLLGNKVAGAVTGGNSRRANDAMVIGYLDGHVKKARPGELAKGTNWTPTTNVSQVTVTNVDEYQWDLQ